MTTTQATEDGASPLAARDGAARDEQRPGRAGRRWCLGTRLVVAATAVWAIVLTLHVLLVDRWWPWLIFEVAPPLTMVAVPLLLLVVTPLARPVRRRLSVVLVVLLLAGAYLAGFGRGWTATPTAGGPAGTTIKVFAWNTNYWDMSDDKGAFYAFLRHQDADVYLLQEYLYWDGDRPVRIDDTARLRAEFPGSSSRASCSPSPGCPSSPRTTRSPRRERTGTGRAARPSAPTSGWAGARSPSTTCTCRCRSGSAMTR